MFMIVFVRRVGESQWQQGKRQSKQQAAHEKAPGHESFVM
jgi:hypothetical protein